MTTPLNDAINQVPSTPPQRSQRDQSSRDTPPRVKTSRILPRPSNDAYGQLLHTALSSTDHTFTVETHQTSSSVLYPEIPRIHKRIPGNREIEPSLPFEDAGVFLDSYPNDVQFSENQNPPSLKSSNGNFAAIFGDKLFVDNKAQWLPVTLKDTPTAFTFGRGGKLIVATKGEQAGLSIIRLLDEENKTLTSKPVLKFDKMKGQINSLVWSEKGVCLAGTSRGKLYQIDLNSKTHEVEQIFKHKINSIVVSPQGKYIVVSGVDKVEEGLETRELFTSVLLKYDHTKERYTEVCKLIENSKIPLNAMAFRDERHFAAFKAGPSTIDPDEKSLYLCIYDVENPTVPKATKELPYILPSELFWFSPDVMIGLHENGAAHFYSVNVNNQRRIFSESQPQKMGIYSCPPEEEREKGRVLSGALVKDRKRVYLFTAAPSFNREDMGVIEILLPREARASQIGQFSIR